MYPIIKFIKIREGFTLPKEFEINFDLYVYSNEAAKSQTIIRFTNTDKKHSFTGARIPLVKLNKDSNKLEIYFQVNGQLGWNFKTNDEIVLNAQNIVVIKQVKEGSDYKFKVSLNGTEQTNVGNSVPLDFENVWLTTGENNGNTIPADGRIENLRVWPGKTCPYLCYIVFVEPSLLKANVDM